MVDLSTRTRLPTGTDVTVWVVFALFVFLRSIDRVFYKRVADRMQNYNMFFISILVPLGTQVMTVALAVAYVGWKRLVQKRGEYSLARFFRMRSPLACGVGAGVFSQLVLFNNSLQAQVGNVVTGVAMPYMGLTTISILMNFTLIFTVLSAVFYTRAQFKTVHWYGCALIVLSSLVSINVELTDGTLGRYKDANGQWAPCSTLWYAVFILGCAPQGFATVYNQRYLQDYDLDVVWSSLWGGWWQMLVGLLLFPVNYVPLPAPAHAYALSSTLAYFRNACVCMVGIAPTDAPADALCVAQGGSSAFWFGMYLLFTTAFNTLLAWLTKRMSGTWATIGSVLCTNVGSALATVPLLMGSEAQPVSLEQVLGLGLSGLAMLVYSSAQETREEDAGLAEGKGADDLAASFASLQAKVLDFPPAAGHLNTGFLLAGAGDSIVECPLP